MVPLEKTNTERNPAAKPVARRRGVLVNIGISIARTIRRVACGELKENA
jgi:hypothetical protein